MRPALLPDRLEARTRALSTHPPEGGFVLYWMRTAVRAFENPALDVALLAARQLGVPAFVYHAVSERYPYASDRHHTFLLEGARDVAAQLAERGIGTAFHLERPGHRGPHLRALSRQAALVVTEEMPVAPLRQWTRALADTVDTPVWSVDTACVVPMRTIGKGVTRAFAYRKRVAPLLDRALEPVEEVAPATEAFVPALPFQPIDWARARIPELVAACAIDHTVGPVPDTRGGSAAGYARWNAFREGGLHGYARNRNDPARDGVSRMSAYLHYGMVAPTRIAREARALGADKFVDELIVWRELPHTWCLYAREHDTLEALPDWARSTLEAHASDPRPRRIDRDALARGRTGEPLWDLCQQSLLRHGELHNNVRMTWGKALLGWTEGPRDALEAIIDLNHRYALDGRDPASYGGILWCLGQFDRPFPETPITGTIRDRSVARHAGRMNLLGYRARVHRPIARTSPRVAVVGGGPAGALCARVLADHGLEVTVFDKGRGAGGRTATRRDVDGRADHGAQYFTVRDPRLQRYLRGWLEAGVVAAWEGPFGTLSPDGFVEETPTSPRYVGTPGMNGLVKHLLADLEVRFGHRVTGLQRGAGAWTVEGEQGKLGRFDQVLVATPAEQAAPLLAAHGAFAASMGQVQSAPCWAVMMAAGDRDTGWAAVRVRDSSIAWVARNGTKPGRGGPARWVIHASPEWSRTHLEDDAHAVTRLLLADLRALPGLGDLVSFCETAHRWRFAQVERPVGQDCLFDPECGLGACGDGLLGGRLEAALLSGAALAGRVLGELDPMEAP